MVKNGAEILIDALVEQGVDTIFGYPGGAVLNIYDALYKNSDRIRHILTAHEQGAAHAADGYARATGKVGVCLATSGPGATNLVTGIATAYMDSIPMVAITGNVGTSLIGRDSFQEVYIAGITMPITKHNFVVRDVEELADTVRDAFRIAASGRPGPVLIDIPKDITAAKCEFIPKGKVEINETYEISDEELQTVADMIAASERPMIYYGGGVETSDAGDMLLQLQRKADIPSAHTMMAIGCIPDTEPLSLGMIGMHGRLSAATCWSASAPASPTALRPTPSVLHRRRRLSTLTLTMRRSIRTSALTMPLFPMRRPSSKRLCRISRRQSTTHGARRLPNGRQSSTMCRRTTRALSIRTSCSARLRRRPRRIPSSQPTLVSTSFGARSTTAASTFVSS